MSGKSVRYVESDGQEKHWVNNLIEWDKDNARMVRIIHSAAILGIVAYFVLRKGHKR
jgi:hypothetical protein